MAPFFCCAGAKRNFAADEINIANINTKRGAPSGEIPVFSKRSRSNYFFSFTAFCSFKSSAAFIFFLIVAKNRPQ